MQYKLLSAKSGQSVENIKSLHKDAIEEAKFLGLKDNLLNEFCLTYLEDELDLLNVKKVTENLNKAFLKSKAMSFKDFMHDLFVEDEGGTMSTDFSGSVPENPLKKKVDKEDEEDILNVK